jgi:hypothetical protein
LYKRRENSAGGFFNSLREKPIMNYPLGNLALCAMLLGAVPVGAHSAKPSGPVKALHGGQSLSAGPYHLELVVKPGELILYVTDHSNNAVSTDGARAKATIQHGFEKANIQVELEPVGDNRLKGTGEFTINPDTGIIVFFKLPEQEAYAARFTPLNTKGGTAQAGEHHHQPKH